MGQYHMVYNLDKKEFIHPHHIENGLKQYEQVGAINSTSTALFALLSNSNNRGGGDFPRHHMLGRWAGDRVVIQGDYAKPEDSGYQTPEQLEQYTDISKEVFDMINTIAKQY